MDERQRYEQGMKLRRGVLGDAHADASLKNRNEFNEAFQDLLTRYAWGEIWSRRGLPLQTRSMITLAMMVALNRTDELRIHLSGALNNGVMREEIREVLLQTAIYAVCSQPTRPFILRRKYLRRKTNDSFACGRASSRLFLRPACNLLRSFPPE